MPGTSSRSGRQRKREIVAAPQVGKVGITVPAAVVAEQNTGHMVIGISGTSTDDRSATHSPLVRATATVFPAVHLAP